MFKGESCLLSPKHLQKINNLQIFGKRLVYNLYIYLSIYYLSKYIPIYLHLYEFSLQEFDFGFRNL